MKVRKSIQPEFIVKVCLMAVGISLVFTVMNFLFLFVVEDEFLDRGLRQEREKIEATHEKTGNWIQPAQANMRLYFTVETLPDGIGDILIEEPERREFYGEEGRHYHLAILEDKVFLVSEVSNQLLVRPMRKGLLVVYTTLAALVALIACFIAFRMARKTIRPISKLAEHVAAIDPDKPLEAFADTYPENEIGLLANQLEESFTRVHAFLEREKRFSRDVSHDLRTPLAVATGASELLAQGNADDREVQKILARQQVALRHMDLTISALLSMVQEKTRSAPTAQPLLGIVENIVIQYSHQLDGKDVELDIQIKRDAVLRIAAGVLEIVLSNILSNAFQYTTRGVIRVLYKDGILSVIDTGGGVPDGIKQDMFKTAVKSDHSSGYGIGLSIVQRLCDHHEIGLSVEHLEGGTAIHLSFV